MNRLQASLTCFCAVFSFQLFSQQLSTFTQYRENQTIINPAAVGSSYFAYGQNLSFGATYRRQWQGIENAPVTATLRGEYMFADGNGVSLLTGGYLVDDRTGPTGYTGLYGRIGGLLTSDPYYGGISAGLSVGAVQYRVNVSEIKLRDPNDVLVGDDQGKIYPDVGLGIYAYQRLDGGFLDEDVVYGGVSVPQVIGLDLAFEADNGEFYTKRVQHFYGMIGMYKYFRDEGFLEPSVWVKYAPNVPLNVDFNLRYQMAQNFWVGVGGALSGTMHGEAGLVLGENLGLDNTVRIGYGFDYSFSSFGPYAGGTHEINISYSLEK